LDRYLVTCHAIRGHAVDTRDGINPSRPVRQFGLIGMLADRASIQNRIMIMKAKLAITVTLLALVCAAPLLSACQTTAGAGEDISAGGHALTNSAEKHAP
jgi:predicted small secreted protein